MTKYPIFTPVKKIYLTRDFIINLIAIICFTFGILIHYFAKSLKEFSLIFFVFSILSIFIGILLKFIGFYKFELLKGYFNGYLILDEDKIIINDKIIQLDEIEKIEIRNQDYRGRFISKGKYNFSNSLSNGEKNILRIICIKKEESVGTYFLQNEKFEINKSKDQLIKYHLAGKLHFLNLIDCINITDYTKIQEFKKEISNINYKTNSIT